MFQRIVNALAEAIEDGRLRAGQTLPTHRALASALGIDLTTVTRAYAEARRQGLTDATVGRGRSSRDSRQAASGRAPCRASISR
ncbi:GntR family transcriptional regulator [Hyphomicrobium nitrativorans]|uniref:GntR family transcriptional regulator n=1 Tax=Hyphomicrobium nitrativorans TaxID=1427356 RepID=UPI000ACBECAE|nr:GntR family transcriptional regulator [Hyphomicrobium nitrativorans]